MTSSLLIDANLLVLFAVGSVSPSLITRHKRLTAYVENDYQLLVDFLAGYDILVITPNGLTEASNLAKQIAEPARGQVADVIAGIAENANEVYVPSAVAAGSKAYRYLGLSDAAILEVKNAHLLTDDVGLYVSKLGQGVTCFNFTHLREAAGITS